MKVSPAGGTEPGPSCAVLVASCDRYADLWPPFFHCWFKYWPDCPYPVYLGSGRLLHPDERIRALPTGDDVSYSDNLRGMLEAMEEEWVIFWIEDRLLRSRVATGVVQSLIAEAQRRDAAYLKLIPEDPLAYTAGEAACGEIPRAVKYRISMTVALWKKQALLDLLRPGETAWQLEKNGSRRSDTQPGPFLALAPHIRLCPPIDQEHTIIKGRLVRRALGFIRREGLAQAYAARQVEAVGTAVYVACYHWFFALVRPLQHRWHASRMERGEGD